MYSDDQTRYRRFLATRVSVVHAARIHLCPWPRRWAPAASSRPARAPRRPRRPTRTQRCASVVPARRSRTPSRTTRPRARHRGAGRGSRGGTDARTPRTRAATRPACPRCRRRRSPATRPSAGSAAVPPRPPPWSCCRLARVAGRGRKLCSARRRCLGPRSPRAYCRVSATCGLSTHSIVCGLVADLGWSGPAASSPYAAPWPQAIERSSLLSANMVQLPCDMRSILSLQRQRGWTGIGRTKTDPARPSDASTAGRPRHRPSS